jgi:hypothetical protein
MLTRVTWRFGAAILLFNASLSLVIQEGAPAQPRLTDRNYYEYSGRQPLAPLCPNTIYCYRVLVPVVLEHTRLDAELRWRGMQWLSHTATGTITGITVAPFASAFITSTLLQSSYAFTFTAYDPYTPDPVVFVIAALILHYWLLDRPFPVTLIVMMGVFIKETAALLSACAAAASLLTRGERQRWEWFAPVMVGGGLLFGFHWYMDTYAGWGISRNPAASFTTGSWLAIWLKNNPSHLRRGVMVFLPFAFGWLFAAAGYRHAPRRLQSLALATVLPIGALVFIQTPERALANAFFVVVPLAAAFLARLAPLTAWVAAITTSLVTARFGLSSDLLPSASILLIPATAAAMWAFASYARNRDKIPST